MTRSTRHSIFIMSFTDRVEYRVQEFDCNRYCLALGWREMVFFVGKHRNHRQVWVRRATSNERAHLDILVPEVVRELLNALARRVNNLQLAPAVQYGSSHPKDVARDVNDEFGERLDTSPIMRIRFWRKLMTGHRMCQMISLTTKSCCCQVISMSVGKTTPWTRLFHHPWVLSRRHHPHHRLVQFQKSVTLMRTSCSPKS